MILASVWMREAKLDVILLHSAKMGEGGPMARTWRTHDFSDLLSICRIAFRLLSRGCMRRLGREGGGVTQEWEPCVPVRSTHLRVWLNVVSALGPN